MIQLTMLIHLLSGLTISVGIAVIGRLLFIVLEKIDRRQLEKLGKQNPVP